MPVCGCLQVLTTDKPSGCPNLTPTARGLDTSQYGRAAVVLQPSCPGTYTVKITHPSRYTETNATLQSYVVQVNCVQQSCCLKPARCGALVA
jgi:hypothetical protein